MKTFDDLVWEDAAKGEVFFDKCGVVFFGENKLVGVSAIHIPKHSPLYTDEEHSYAVTYAEPNGDAKRGYKPLYNVTKEQVTKFIQEAENETLV